MGQHTHFITPEGHKYKWSQRKDLKWNVNVYVYVYVYV